MVFVCAALYVEADGTLTATCDNNRFYNVEGFKCFVSPLDTEEIDVIKPFQTQKNGMYEYYTHLCETPGHADGDAGRTDESSPENERTDTKELAMRYETEQQYDSLQEYSECTEAMSSARGCTLFMAFVLLSTLVLFLSFLNWATSK